MSPDKPRLLPQASPADSPSPAPAPGHRSCASRPPESARPIASDRGSTTARSTPDPDEHRKSESLKKGFDGSVYVRYNSLDTGAKLSLRFKPGRKPRILCDATQPDATTLQRTRESPIALKM